MDGSGSAVLVVLPDYRKAFDLVDQILWQPRLRIPRGVACWVCDFLMDRRQRVKLSSDCSLEWGAVPSGVPQGIKLGPGLFILMINNLHAPDFEAWKYVDDTTLAEVVLRGGQSARQVSVTAVEQWSITNMPQLNPDKCKELLIDFKRTVMRVKPGSSILGLVEDGKDTLVRIRSAWRKVRLLGSALRSAIAKLNVLSSISEAAPSGDPKERGVAEVDMVGVAEGCRTFTDPRTLMAGVTQAGFKDGGKADFIVVEGDGRTLLGRETTEVLNLLRVGPFQANTGDGGRPDGDVREKYKQLFSGVGVLRGYELKLLVDESEARSAAASRVAASLLLSHTESYQLVQAVDVWSDIVSKEYQQIIRDVIKGCAGVAYISDDLIVHGCNEEEHDKRLSAVLDRLSEVGLTVNGDKCKLRLSKLKLFGHELTNDGINPCKEKIAAIRDAGPPKDANEEQSFMGLVQYSSKLMPDVSSVAMPIQELTRKDVVSQWDKE
ncbi:Transposon Tf2-6 polyprotein [Stylophora pistillata]|uniref:Transposon Tf2-6 polyprotein n=1 Tax=Stylophora pistillata TaxID=50429 RepID=A0A2B4RV63_STYPI|nr:Transposon Tf2-6 polyprotein [Stylophora pistillata]